MYLAEYYPNKLDGSTRISADLFQSFILWNHFLEISDEIILRAS